MQEAPETALGSLAQGNETPFGIDRDAEVLRYYVRCMMDSADFSGFKTDQLEAMLKGAVDGAGIDLLRLPVLNIAGIEKQYNHELATLRTRRVAIGILLMDNKQQKMNPAIRSEIQQEDSDAGQKIKELQRKVSALQLLKMVQKSLNRK